MALPADVKEWLAQNKLEVLESILLEQDFTTLEVIKTISDAYLAYRYP